MPRALRALGASLLCACATVRPCTAQAPTYTAAQLACAAFEVQVRTDVTTELEGRRRVEEIRRNFPIRNPVLWVN